MKYKKRLSQWKKQQTLSEKPLGDYHIHSTTGIMTKNYEMAEAY